ncbi:MAG: hypothetical protein IGS54_05570 [Elainella sp. C42_A2020_010]|nr:hypothetical protein [Elainella sp. C42_A2020_010]
MRSMNRVSSETSMPIKTEPSIKEIPYDYVATFKLLGKPGNRVQDVLNISVEGAFVAVAIGYSFIPAPLNLSALPPIPTPTPTPTPIPIVSALSDSAFDWVLKHIIEPIIDPRVLMRCWALRMCGIDFKYSIVDSGSGRELQNQPIHNLAGLGEASGDRPFRLLAKPMMFTPRSTIRIEIEEISTGSLYEGAQLYFVLHGYKLLGYGTGLP